MWSVRERWSARNIHENGSGRYSACEASPWSILACAGKPTGSDHVRRCGGSRAKNGEGSETCEGGVARGGTTIVAKGEEERQALGMVGVAGPLALAQEYVGGQGMPGRPPDRPRARHLGRPPICRGKACQSGLWWVSVEFGTAG